MSLMDRFMTVYHSLSKSYHSPSQSITVYHSLSQSIAADHSLSQSSTIHHSLITVYHSPPHCSLPHYSLLHYSPLLVSSPLLFSRTAIPSSSTALLHCSPPPLSATAYSRRMHCRRGADVQPHTHGNTVQRFVLLVPCGPCCLSVFVSVSSEVLLWTSDWPSAQNPLMTTRRSLAVARYLLGTYPNLPRDKMFRNS
jgi:hypothetical protein